MDALFVLIVIWHRNQLNWKFLKQFFSSSSFFPQAVFPNTIFEAIVKIPYDKQVKQIMRNGTTGELNIGAVLMLPDRFQIAPMRMNRAG